MANVDLYCANMEENGYEGASIRTDAGDAKEFLDAFVDAICSRFGISDKPSKDVIQALPDQRETLRKWVGQAFDIHAKLRGYKAEKVYEKRIMWSGDIQPYYAWHVGGSGAEPDGIADGLEGLDRGLLLQKLTEQWHPIEELWRDASEPDNDDKWIELREAVASFDEAIAKLGLLADFAKSGKYALLLKDLATVEEGRHPRSGEDLDISAIHVDHFSGKKQ